MSTEHGEQPETEQAAAEPDDAPRLPPRKLHVLAVVVVLAYAVDLITKVVALATLEGQEPVRVLGGAVYFQVVRNPGAAFSMATGLTWVLTIIATAVVITICWIARKLRSSGWAVGLGLILAGALGNLTDRFFRAPGPLQGHVVDFVSVFAPNGEAFPIFNAADSSITIGGALVVLLSLLGKDYDGRSTRSRRAKDGREASSG
ncbi:MAG: signal peptidase II [Pseudonocardiaceae bacterium]|nr:signal peptidase II [Pseudonocardiaceae bacterium]